jgi:integrase
MTPTAPKKATSYIEYKDGIPYAALTIPVELREKIGKRKYRKKLEAISPRKAQLEAASLVAGWKKEIALHKALLDDETRNPLLKIIMEALDLRKDFEQADLHSEEGAESDREVLREQIEILARGKIKSKHGEHVASEFYEIAVGGHTPLLPLYNEWSKSKLKNYSLKTSDSYRRDAKMFVDKFVHLEAVTKRSMKEWVAYLMEYGTDPQKVKPMTLTTLRDRFMCGVRHFYNYIDSRGLIDEEKVNPMEGVIPKEEKTKINLSNKGWIPFDPKDVSQIYNAIPKDDHQLSTVTAIAMFTGMRIEEICSLTVAQIIDVDGIRCFDIVDSKTRAGIRVVPIHPLIAPLVDSLLSEVKGDAEEAPKDAFLISGLKANKYDDRSNAVGKRFGRLKKELGFDEKKVFHSIRKCVVTQLDRAGYRETSIANLVGHDNPNMTAGRYSAGIDAPIMKPMIESLKYPAFKLK